MSGSDEHKVGYMALYKMGIMDQHLRNPRWGQCWDHKGGVDSRGHTARYFPFYFFPLHCGLFHMQRRIEKIYNQCDLLDSNMFPY